MLAEGTTARLPDPVRGATTAGAEVLLELRREEGRLRGQVEGGLREAIRSGRLDAGSRLPASRVLADDLGVSRRLVSDAHEQLRAEGWLTSRRGRERGSRPRHCAVGGGRAPPEGPRPAPRYGGPPALEALALARLLAGGEYEAPARRPPPVRARRSRRRSPATCRAPASTAARRAPRPGGAAGARRRGPARPGVVRPRRGRVPRFVVAVDRPAQTPGVVLGYGNLPEPAIDEGVRCWAEVLRAVGGS